MNDKLPVYIENMELPVDKNRNINENNKNSYGYVNILYLASLLITTISVLTIIFLGK